MSERVKLGLNPRTGLPMDETAGAETIDTLKQIDESLKKRPTDAAQEAIQAANWPSEFRALGEFIFRMVLSIAASEPVPMAITTAG